MRDACYTMEMGVQSYLTANELLRKEEKTLSQIVLRKAVWKINEKCTPQNRKKQEEILEVQKRVNRAYSENEYDFSCVTNKQISKDIGTRDIKHYWDWKTENILCSYLKIIVDKACHITCPNRKNIVKELFECLKIVREYREFAICRFDFENFFESLSPLFIYHKVIASKLSNRNDKELLRVYSNAFDKCYAGLPLSNAYAEAIGREFDEKIQFQEKTHGMIFYCRYVDDCIIIYNKKSPEDEILGRIQKYIRETFNDIEDIDCKACSVGINKSIGKYSYLSELSNENEAFNYLGYEFYLTEKKKIKGRFDFKYGITEAKRKKYASQVAYIVESCKNEKDTELLRHRLRAFCRRIVFRDNKSKIIKWKEQGFISNYSELRFHIGYDIHEDTRDFLHKCIYNACMRYLNRVPYFLKCKSINNEEAVLDEKRKQVQLSPAYTLLGNMERNRVLFFDEEYKLGINREKLASMLKEINIHADPNQSYRELLFSYLRNVCPK